LAQEGDPVKGLWATKPSTHPDWTTRTVKLIIKKCRSFAEALPKLCRSSWFAEALPKLCRSSAEARTMRGMEQRPKHQMWGMEQKPKQPMIPQEQRKHVPINQQGWGTELLRSWAEVPQKPTQNNEAWNRIIGHGTKAKTTNRRHGTKAKTTNDSARTGGTYANQPARFKSFAEALPKPYTKDRCWSETITSTNKPATTKDPEPGSHVMLDKKQCIPCKKATKESENYLLSLLRKRTFLQGKEFQSFRV
jgi:hypothetical protein